MHETQYLLLEFWLDFKDVLEYLWWYFIDTVSNFLFQLFDGTSINPMPNVWKSQNGMAPPSGNVFFCKISRILKDPIGYHYSSVVCRDVKDRGAQVIKIVE